MENLYEIKLIYKNKWFLKLTERSSSRYFLRCISFSSSSPPLPWSSLALVSWGVRTNTRARGNEVKYDCTELWMTLPTHINRTWHTLDYIATKIIIRKNQRDVSPININEYVSLEENPTITNNLPRKYFRLTRRCFFRSYFHFPRFSQLSHCKQQTTVRLILDWT